MPKRTKDYHAWLIKRLSDPAEAERYLRVAVADKPEIFLKALRNVAEANRMAKVAEDAGVNRESLYKTLSKEGNPRYSTLDAVLAALGMELTVRRKKVTESNPQKTERDSNSVIAIEGTPTGFHAQSNTDKPQGYIFEEKNNPDDFLEIATTTPRQLVAA